jgi:hypothetical protein
LAIKDEYTDGDVKDDDGIRGGVTDDSYNDIGAF